MPEMTLLGWFHTILGVLAVLSGFYTLYQYRVISIDESSGKVYILVTLLVAGSGEALMRITARQGSEPVSWDVV